MLMKNNFIHADCHGGNILVKISERSSSFFSEMYEYLKKKIARLEAYLIESTLNSETLRKLYAEGRKEE